MRRLLFIPDVHTRRTVGLSIDFNRSPDIEREAEEESSRLLKIVKEVALESGIDFSKIKFFQEGCFEEGIFLASSYRGIFSGVTSEATENSEIYSGEGILGQRLVDMLESLPEDLDVEEPILGQLEDLAKKIDEAMQKRDEVISGNINRGLKEGEIGILIIGASHYGMLGMLASDIVVELFDPRLREFVEGAPHGSLYDSLFGDETTDMKRSRLEDLDTRYHVRREGSVG